MKRFFNCICIASMLCILSFSSQAQTPVSNSNIRSESKTDSGFQALKSFELSNSVSTVKINWQTSSEINLNYFEIQRSTDGVHFDVIALMFAQENAENGASYQYADYNMSSQFSGFLYYQLRVFDMNGKSVLISPKRIEKRELAIRR